MTTKKISEFNTASSPLSGTEYLLGIQNGETVKMPVLPTGIVSGGTPETPINITNHNDVIQLSASYTGEITSYVGSGTTITVLEGIDILTYDGVGENPGTWTATATATNVVVGSFTAVDGTLVVGNHSGISINIDNSLIVYNIIGKRLDGTSFTGSTKQAISKTKSGAPGLAYQVAVESSNGTEFRVGENSSTLLTARIFLNGVEITDSTPASWFSWRRTSMVPDPPPNDDATWNSLYSTGFKQVLIYVDDVDSKATFFCDIISP